MTKTAGKIVLKTLEGKAIEITGKQAELVLDAVREALDIVGAELVVSNKGVVVLDEKAPAHFSYVEAALIALISGKKTVEEIRESILLRREASLGLSSS